MSEKKSPIDVGIKEKKTERVVKGTEKTINKKEEIYTGIGASRGIAIGMCYAFVKEQGEHDFRKLEEKDVTEEVERFLAALRRSEKELKKIEKVTTRKLGKGYSDLFQAQIMVLHDPVLVKAISNRILSEHKPAHVVIEEEFDQYVEKLKNSDELLFRERADDLQDIKDRIIRNLHIKKLHSWLPEGVIVVSYHLSPADVILLSRSNIKGFITDTGGKTSHISLICKSLNIPIVVGFGNLSQKVSTGMQMILDASTGKVIINPEEKTLAYYTEKQRDEKQIEDKASLTAELPATTKCGVRITFYANIDFKEELDTIKASGAEGVGLFRSENLFTDGTNTPRESLQYAYYREMADTINPMPIDIRLFDIGGDKLLYSPIKEPNPNLGWRGIRILIDIPDILEAQIRAIVRANTHGNIDILIPMIVSIDEIRQVRSVVDKAFAELEKEDPMIEKPEVGAMIEVPAAVELIDEITRYVDFISIGTNDLTQYTLAVDRNNIIVQDLFDTFHPAIVRQLYRIISTAQKNRCRAMICGDMGSNPVALPFLLGCGLKRFSVVVSDIPNLKTQVSRYTLAETEELARKCIAFETASEIKSCLEAFQAAH
jgi:phosphoenolpyruvate-protein phosphotransferase (PTS system enzyme I)